MNKREKEEALLNIIKTVTGGIKLKETGEWLNPLKGDVNKNFGTPEMKICLQDLQNAVEHGAYTYTDKNGKVWIPVRLQVWGKDEGNEPVRHTPRSVENVPDFDDEVPY